MERWLIYAGMWAIILGLLYIRHKVIDEKVENKGPDQTGPTNG